MSCPAPTYEDVMSDCAVIAGQSPGMASYEEIGRSTQGRPIPLLTITDPSVPVEDKAVFLLSGGTDGNEEVGRAAAVGFARAMLEPQHRVHLQRQVFLVVPVANPDGTVLNLPDRQGNGSGIAAHQVHLPEPPATQEGRVMRELAETWIPDAHVDIHGLAGGGMGDSLYLYPTVNNKWAIPVLFEVARELQAAGARAGFPQDRSKLWWEPRHNLPGWLARNSSTFCMVMEATENYYPIEESVRACLVRLMRLIEIGEEVRFFQPYPNYPCDVVSGGPMGALMPIGNNYAARRKSRRDLSRMVMESVRWFGRTPCDRDWTAEIALPIDNSAKTLPPGMVFQATIDRRATIEKVLWQDHLLDPGQWTSWASPGGIVVRATVSDSPSKGMNKLRIQYKVPFKRHVEPPAERE